MLSADRISCSTGCSRSDTHSSYSYVHEIAEQRPALVIRMLPNNSLQLTMAAGGSVQDVLVAGC